MTQATQDKKRRTNGRWPMKRTKKVSTCTPCRKDNAYAPLAADMTNLDEHTLECLVTAAESLLCLLPHKHAVIVSRVHVGSRSVIKKTLTIFSHLFIWH